MNTKFRVAVINHTFQSPSMMGWGWSLNEKNQPRDFETEAEATRFAAANNSSSSFGRGWEWRVIAGPPFALPEPPKLKYALSNPRQAFSN